MSIEIKHPFQLAPDGSIAIVTDPNVQANQHIRSLLSTSPGERVMQPNYGVDVKGTVFLPDAEIAVFNLKQEITAAMTAYEPNINVVSIDVVDTYDPEDPTAIEMEWSINNVQTGTATGVTTATVLVGGTVVTSGG